MNSIRILLVAIWGIMLPNISTVGQESKQISQRVQKQFIEASEDYTHLELRSALSKLNKILKNNPQYADAWIMKAYCEEELNKKNDALRSYISGYMADTVKYHAVSFEIANLYFNSGKYTESEIYLRKYKSTTSPDSDTVRLIGLSRNLSFAIQQIEDYNGFPLVRPLEGVNTTDFEYFPTLTVDGKQLVFTRQELEVTEQGSKRGQEDLFVGLLTDNLVTSIERMKEPLNSNSNEGTQTIRQDGRLMMFTSCNRPDTKGGCDLYHSIKLNTKWTEPVNIGYPVNTRYWESTPCFGPDGRSLYFSSNRPGGYGGMDIWMSTYDPASGWQNPMNLGSSINTSEDELSPFIHGDGKSLYFSSKGWTGMGGLDIFIARMDSDKTWLTPTNMGFPMNTYSDEFGITLAGSGEFALFSSNRDSLTNMDLYKINLPKELRPESLDYISGKVIDSISKKAVGAKIEVRDQFGKLFQSVDSDPFTGEFLVGMPRILKLSFVVREPGYFYYSELFEFDTANLENSKSLVIPLLPIRKGEIKILHQIYFDFDSAELKSESAGEIAQLFQMMSENLQMQILITGHTDSQGTADYNTILSRKRAESIRQGLVNRGIQASRIKCLGAGSSEPIAENSTEKGRSQNRRTEIRIL